MNGKYLFESIISMKSSYWIKCRNNNGKVEIKLTNQENLWELVICNCLQNLQKTKTIINAKFRGLYSSKWFLVWVIIPITCWPTWASKQIEWDSPFRFNRICLFLWRLANLWWKNNDPIRSFYDHWNF